MEIVIDINVLSQLLVYSSIVVFILIIWFETDAFYEYLNLFSFGKALKEYKVQKEKFGVSLPGYLLTKKNCFISRLLECPICLCVWLNLGFLIWHKEMFLFFGVFYLSLILYFLFNFLMKRQDL